MYNNIYIYIYISRMFQLNEIYHVKYFNMNYINLPENQFDKKCFEIAVTAGN